MLAALVLAGILAAPVGTAALLIGSRAIRAGRPGRGRPPAGSRSRSSARLVLAALVAVAMRLLGVTEHNTIAGVAGLVVGSLIWLPVTRRWNARGHLCWSTSIFLFAVYLAYVLDWTFYSHLGPASDGGRAAAVALRAVRRDPGQRLPVGDLRRDRLGDLATGGSRRATTAQLPAARRAPVRQPARPGAQRAAGHGHRHAPLAGAPRLPALRDHPDRRQHRRREPVAAGRGLVQAAQREVRAPGGLAGLQVGGAELRADAR